MVGFDMAATAKHTNLLIHEKSPYLLQHAHNPVDWFPWGEAAFARARAERKPVFLSIGYSTCHWCHVMERESFETEPVAAFLREHFVSIKVDREERPDVDKIYMTFVQSTTGSGGWPLNVFLTPDLKPFFGGTYFPPEDRGGRRSFLSLLQEIAAIWKKHEPEIVASADDIHARMQTLTQAATELTALSREVLQRAGVSFKATYDAVNGGFSEAPKFPQPSRPLFLLRYAKRFNDAEARRMVLHTSDKMAAGGIHDQLGGGFARYSVDERWLVPHFEKMLYDNAQLAQLYLEAYQVSGEQRHAEVARDILDYVLRDLTHPEGGFYSAEDADSEGQEGKFYCWTHDELAKLLSPEEFIVVVDYFGITKEGNFMDHSHPHPLPGLNVLSVVQPDVPAADQPLLAAGLAKMRAVRAQRVRPFLDDKILASWNGLMLGALARAGVILDEPRYLAAAQKNLTFLRDHLWVATEPTLYHRWRNGTRDEVQLLEAYAFLLAGVLELYEATLQVDLLDFAIALAEAMLRQFYDPLEGGFWQSPTRAPDLILRIKDDYDGAEPAGNSVATLALLRLAAMTERADFKQAAERTLQRSAAQLDKLPQASSCLLQALDFWVDEPLRVVIAGAADPAATRSLLRAAHAVYQPNKIVLGTTGAVSEFVRSLPAPEGALAYVCTGTACQSPTSDPAKLRELLK